MELPLLHMLAWSALPVVAILNGVIREQTYGKRLTPTVAHSLAVVPLVAVVIGWACVLAWWWPLGAAHAWLVGVVWSILTVAFEFGLGTLRGRGLREMLPDWNVRRGRLWPLVPLATLMAPSLARLLVGV